MRDVKILDGRSMGAARAEHLRSAGAARAHHGRGPGRWRRAPSGRWTRARHGRSTGGARAPLGRTTGAALDAGAGRHLGAGHGRGTGAAPRAHGARPGAVWAPLHAREPSVRGKRAVPRGLPTRVGPRPAHPHPRQPPSIDRARARAMPLGGPPARPNSPFLACRLELRGQNPSVAECRVCRSELGRARVGRTAIRRAPVDAHPIDAQGNPHPSLGGGRVSCRSAVRRVGRTARFWPVGSSRGAKIVGSRSAERQVFKRGVHRDSASSVRVGQVWPWAVRMDFSSSEPWWCLA